MRTKHLLQLALARRALAARGLLHPLRNNFNLVKEHFAKLFRRAYVELASGGFINAFFYLFKLCTIVFRETSEHFLVNENSPLLHFFYNMYQRFLYFFIHVFHSSETCQLFLQQRKCGFKCAFFCKCEYVVKRRVCEFGRDEPEHRLPLAKTLGVYDFFSDAFGRSPDF